MNPDSATVRTKGCPALTPTVARNIARPKFRKNDIGRQRHGPEHGAGAAQFAEDESDDERSAADAERHDTHAGNGNRNKPKKDAEDHPDPERDVAEFRRRLDRIAEVAADFFLSVGRRQHADPVAEFQHQVGRRDQVGIVATDVQQMGRITGRHWKTGKGDADHVGLSDEDPDVVEIGAVAGQPAGFQSPELGRRLGDRLFALGNNQEASPAARTVSAVGTKLCPPFRTMVTCRSLSASVVRSPSRRPAKLSPIEISPIWKRCVFAGNFGFTMRVMK